MLNWDKSAISSLEVAVELTIRDKIVFSKRSLLEFLK